ncbi:MAG: hypothetical protein WC683_17475 [bacterium]
MSRKLEVLQPQRSDPFVELKRVLVEGELGMPFVIEPGGGQLCVDLTPPGTTREMGYLILRCDGTWRFMEGQEGQ